VCIGVARFLQDLVTRALSETTCRTPRYLLSRGEPMQRQKKSRYDGGRYPDIGRYVRVYARKAGVGLVVGVAATGCIWPWHVDGDIAFVDTGETAWQDTGAIPGDMGETGEVHYAMLPDTGERNLQFEDPVWGWIDYRVEIVVEDRSLYNWILNNPELALAALDAALLAHTITDFHDYQDDSVIEAQLMQALADAMSGAVGSDTSAFRELRLIIVNYTDENDIDGDIG
jgi:hypothetical protein